jgi:outer membrane lipoprotein-sorting protein
MIKCGKGKRIILLALFVCLCFSLVISSGCKKKDQSEEARQDVPAEQTKDTTTSGQVVQSRESEKSTYVSESEQAIQSNISDKTILVSKSEQIFQSSASEETEHLYQPEIVDPNRASIKINLRILYAGLLGTDRAKDFIGFLSEHFEKVETTDYNTFTGNESIDFDVAIIDYDGKDTSAPRSNISRQYTRATVTMGVPGAFLCSRLSLKTGYL